MLLVNIGLKILVTIECISITITSDQIKAFVTVLLFLVSKYYYYPKLTSSNYKNWQNIKDYIIVNRKVDNCAISKVSSEMVRSF